MTPHEHYWHPVAEPVRFLLPDPAFDAVVGVRPSSLTVICECGAVEQR